MPQFLIIPNSIEGNRVTLSAEESKHLIKVLRHKAGDTLWITDGKNRYLAAIETVSPKSATLKLLEKLEPTHQAPPPALGIALLKHDHLESVLQKGVELGVQDFFLFSSERTIPHYKEGATPKKIARFEKIALEGAKQSGMVGVPKIHPLLTFEDLARQFKKFSGVLLAWEQERTDTFHAVFETVQPTKLLVLIGPEGGFSADEVALAEKEGAKKISLGNQILRSETAAIALLTLCQYELGNM